MTIMGGFIAGFLLSIVDGTFTLNKGVGKRSRLPARIAIYVMFGKGIT